jgi:hypothetical protein
MTGIAHTRQCHGAPRGQLAIGSGRVLLAVGFPGVRATFRGDPRPRNQTNRRTPANPPWPEAGCKTRKGACDADRTPRNREGRLSPRTEFARPRARSTRGSGHDGQGHSGARLPARAGIDLVLLWHRGERRADGLGHRRQGASFELPIAPDGRSPLPTTPMRTPPSRE